MFEQENLLDENLDKVIVRCYINQLRFYRNEVSVIYEDGVQEVIFHYNPMEYDYDKSEFIGKTKLAAAFYCDKKKPIPVDFRRGQALFRNKG